MKDAAYYRKWRATADDPHKAVRDYQARKPEVPAYHKQKYRAKERGIDWEFTFETWVEWWGDDFNKRGRMGLHMARIGDEGPYSPDNCIKATASDNLKGLV